MKQVITGGIYLSSFIDSYGSLMGGMTAVGDEWRAKQIIPAAGTLSNFRISFASAPGAGKSRTLTIRINGVDQLAVTVSGTSTTGVNTGSVAVSAGDEVSVSHTSTGSPSGATARMAVIFEGTTAGESILMGTSNGGVLHTSAARYVPVVSGDTNPTGTAADCQQVIPTPGTFKKLYWGLSSDPGTSPDEYKMTLVVNGSPAALTSSIIADNTTGNDTANTVGVSAGDKVYFQIEPVSSPSASPSPKWGCVFVSDTDGESLILGGSTDALNNAAAEYMNKVGTQGYAWNATEYKDDILNACVLKKFYVELSGSPYADDTAADTYQFDVRLDGTNTDLTVTIADGGTGNLKANDTAHSATATDGQTLTLKCTPASSPTIRDAYWGLVCYIAPAASVEITPAVGGLSVAGIAPRNDLGIMVPTEVDA